MELRDYVRILRKRGWIILLVGLLTAGAAFGFSQLQTVVYKSSVNISVFPDRIDNGTLLATKAILRGFRAYIDSEDFAARVIRRLGLDMVPNTLKTQVTIATKDEDYLIQIDVLNTDGNAANDIARAWATAFVEWRQQENTKQRKEDRVSAFIVQEPNYGKFRPQTTLNTVAGGIIGLMLGTLIVFFLESIEANILRAPDDVERATGLTVIGAIPATSAESARSRRAKSTA
ncbi:MAG TPA: Wzz/FepE/Etk N-terminal domain-containing protein [Anaerolineae bacterium]|nr:Wzz/FepE/Etk N-terminal domain-containing protein [Anaerolineae bacterium]